MDPFANRGLQDAKLHTSTSTRAMPPPPAYEMVVDPNAPIPNLRSPYDPEEEEDKTDEIPEVIIHAATQIRGHGNIISVPPMDATKIVGMLHTMLFGPVSPTSPVPPQNAATQGASDHGHEARMKALRINITVNCGATVVGDKNIVGPGLGDIARHMQVANRNQAQRATTTTAAGATAGATSGATTRATAPFLEGLVTGMTTPRSQTASESGRSEASEASGVAGRKRKANGEVEGGPEGKRRETGIE